MRADASILAAAMIILAACASPGMTPEQRRKVLDRTTGTIVGTVREAGTSRPLESVFVSARYLGDQTEADGRFRITYIDPGEVEVTAWRRDLIETRKRVRVLAGRESAVDLVIERSPPPCCRLAGTWSVRLVLREPGRLPVPRGTEVAGVIIFSADVPDPFPDARQHVPADDRTLDEFASYDIDLRSILGEDITSATSNTIFGGRPGSDILKEATGFVHHRNAVAITLIPRMSHGGISFTGTINGDEVRGEWIKRDYAPSVSGTFLMRRNDR